MPFDFRRMVRRTCLVLVATVIAVSLAGCAVTPAVTHWHRLSTSPPERALTDELSAMHIVQPIELRVNGSTTVRINHSDPTIWSDGAVSYAKLFRFQGQSPGSYEIRVDAWCDCPWTAILWGTNEFPIFHPKVVVLDRTGARLVSRGEVDQLDPSWTWTTARWRGRWSISLPETGPYWMVVTSQDTGPKTVGELGGDLFQFLRSSPVGKIRLRVRRIR